MRGDGRGRQRAANRRSGPWGQRLISLLICISALGAINGTIFTGARIYYAMGTEHRLYAWLGRWSPRWQTPARSLADPGGRDAGAGRGLRAERLRVREHGDLHHAGLLDLLPAGGRVACWCSAGAIRRRRGLIACPGYPWTPLVFCLSSLFMLYAQPFLRA